MGQVGHGDGSSRAWGWVKYGMGMPTSTHTRHRRDIYKNECNTYLHTIPVHVHVPVHTIHTCTHIIHVCAYMCTYTRTNHASCTI